MDVPDVKLYYALLRLGIVAYQQETRPPPAMDSPANFDPLPKHTLKTLMAKFNVIAMSPSSESDDALLRRSYLAFYSVLLSLKKQDVSTYEEFKMRPDLLIIRFITTTSKELAKSPELKERAQRTATVNVHTVEFITLLLQIVRSLSKASNLITQLENYKNYHYEMSQKVESLDYNLQKMDLVLYLKRLLREVVLTDAMLQKDVHENINLNPQKELSEYVQRLMNNQHPVYSPDDFDEAWDAWKASEINQTNKLIASLKRTDYAGTERIIPQHPRAYFGKVLKYCLEIDLAEPVLLGPKSQKLLNLCCCYWRIPANTYASLILQCAGEIQVTNLDLDYLQQCFTFMNHLADCPLPEQWPKIDALLAKQSAIEIRNLALDRLVDALQLILEEHPPKLGPFIELIEILVQYTGANSAQISEKHLNYLKKAILSAAEGSYDKMLKKIPRDQRLDLLHIVELGDGVIAIAKRLQKRYKMALFNEIQIAKLVCSRQLRLFGIDFMPMFKYCLEGQPEEPNFEDIIQLYQTVSALKNLFDQVSVSENFNFDVENLFYPYMLQWAQNSAQLAKTWVIPAIEQDSFQPLDADAEIMYSSSVKDLFNSFSASIQVVQSVAWVNQYHVSKIYTLLVKGMGEAMSIWVQRLRNSFICEMSTEPVMSGAQSKWIELAKETIQGQHANPPEPFNFKTETLVYLNDIDAAYDRLFKMEEMLDSDSIARRIEVEEKKKKTEMATYLYTISIVKAEDLVADTNKRTRDAYVTVIDELARKKIGRTRTVHENLNPVWNQRFELETSARSQNVKLMVWDENQNSNHGLCGSAFIKLDAKEFRHREWGTIFKSVHLEQKGAGPSNGKIDVQISMDVEREDIRFFFGKALRFLQHTKTEMIDFIVEKFSSFIGACISMNTIDILLGRSKFNLSSWLPNSHKQQTTITQDQIEDVLDPMFDYLNRNFSTLAAILTTELRLEVMIETWKYTLRKIESLILAKLERQKHIQPQLTPTEMDVIYTWLRSLRDFFHHDGAGPSLESLQDRLYQKIMSIPVYYDMTTMQLRQECDKITKSSLKQLSSTIDLVQRQRTVMAHRNRRVVQTQAAEMRKAHLATLDLDKDDILLRILRMRKDHEFIDKQLDYRKRIEIKANTERALHGLQS